VDVIDRVKEIVADIINVPVTRLTEDSGHENAEGWDSMAQIKIIMTVESEFDALFTPEEVQDLNTVRKIVAAVQAR
jgi:acyl carrier protein